MVDPNCLELPAHLAADKECDRVTVFLWLCENIGRMVLCLVARAFLSSTLVLSDQQCPSSRARQRVTISAGPPPPPTPPPPYPPPPPPSTAPNHHHPLISIWTVQTRMSFRRKWTRRPFTAPVVAM